MKKYLDFVSKKVVPPVAEQFLGPLILFLLTPLIITRLGATTYGMWVLLITISMFSQVLCMGITAWIAKTVSESLADNNTLKLNNIISSSFGLILSVFMLALLLSFTVYIFFSVDNVNSYFVFLCVFSGLFNEIDNLFTNATKGYELFHYSLIMEVTGRIAWGGAVLLGVYTNNLLLLTLAAIILKAIIKYFYFCFFVYKSKIIPLFSFKSFKDRYNESRWMFVQLLGGTSLSLFDRLLIPAVLGVGKLASYTPCIQLAQLAFTVPAAANQILMPMFSRFKTRGSFPHKWLGMAILASFLSATPCVVLFIFSKEILTLWISSSFAEQNYMILNTLAIAYGFLSAFSIFHFIMLGIGESKLVAKINLMGGILTIIATTFLAQFGVHYIAYAKLIYPLMQTKYLSTIWFFRRKEKR